MVLEISRHILSRDSFNTISINVAVSVREIVICAILAFRDSSNGFVRFCIVSSYSDIRFVANGIIFLYWISCCLFHAR